MKAAAAAYSKLPRVGACEVDTQDAGSLFEDEFLHVSIPGRSNVKSNNELELVEIHRSNLGDSFSLPADKPNSEGDLSSFDRQKQLQLWRLENLAVPLCYFAVGLVQGMTAPFINVYPLELGATETQQATLWFISDLPSCLKIFMGFMSDSVPICGYRRKPYMVLGWLIAIFSMSLLLLFSDLTLPRVPVTGKNNSNNFTKPLEAWSEEDPVNNYTNFTGNSTTFQQTLVAVPPADAPSMAMLCSAFFVWGIGLWTADVMGDSLIAVKAKLETDEDRGNLQAVCYLLRGFGIATMYPLSSLIYPTLHGPRYIITATTFCPLVVLLPFVYWLREEKINSHNMLSTLGQIQELYNTACSKAVWQPMSFVYLYLLLQISNAAWKEFLKSIIGFTPTQLNILLMAAGVLAFSGVVVYKFVLNKWSWRTIYILSIGVNGIFSMLQILLIRGETFGLDPFLFALGDDGVRDFVMGLQYLPMCIMMVNLVPTGIEGASYALFTTTLNAASSLCGALGTVLLGIWDVSKETMMEGDLSGITKLTILTTVLQTLPLLLVGLLPHTVDHIYVLRNDPAASSRVGGSIYLGVVLISVLLAVAIGIMNVIYPGWMGES